MDCGLGHCQLAAAKSPFFTPFQGPRGLPGGNFMTQRQPFLHDLNVLLAAPMQAWSGHDGQLRPGGAQGIYCADTRVISEAVLLVSGEEPEMVGSNLAGGGAATFHALVRTVGGEGSDPLVRLARTRTVTTEAVSEHILLSSDL